MRLLYQRTATSDQSDGTSAHEKGQDRSTIGCESYKPPRGPHLDFRKKGIEVLVLFDRVDDG